jgi:hypothetical protein
MRDFASRMVALIGTLPLPLRARLASFLAIVFSDRA